MYFIAFPLAPHRRLRPRFSSSGRRLSEIFSVGRERPASRNQTMRPLVPVDADALLAVYGDPKAMRFSVAGAHRSRADALRSIRYPIEHQANYGFSTWAIRLSVDGEPIGTFGLEFLPDGRVEIGYSLRRDHWRKGYATEAARAWLDYGFTNLGLGRIVAMIEEANRPSTRVAEKIGMRAGAPEIFHGIPVNVHFAQWKYAATAPIASLTSRPGGR
jgi:[ribosomal protein S5]-alanine N-acetyltransferase